MSRPDPFGRWFLAGCLALIAAAGAVLGWLHDGGEEP